MIDHYQTLGLDPTADGAAIRARYVAEMKAAHPDRNASPETLRRAQDLTAAYAVLGDPARREIYDSQRAALERWERIGEGGAVSARRSGGGTVWLLLLLAAAGGAAFYLPRLAEPVRVASRPDPAANDMPSSRCAALARDPSLRGALADGLERGGLSPLALTALAAASVDVERPLAGPDGGCVATLRIDLPAGFAAAGGQRTILSEVALSAERGAVAVEHDRSLEGALATVAPVDVPLRPPPADPQLAEPTPVVPDRVAPVIVPPPPAPRRATIVEAPPQRRPAPAVVPAARSRVEVDGSRQAAPRRSPPPPAAAPADPPPAPRIALAPVERQTRAFFTQAWTNAGADKRARLSATQNAFNARLSACASDACRRDSYLARNVEISRIMMGE